LGGDLRGEALAVAEPLADFALELVANFIYSFFPLDKPVGYL
jgi:hypothetical protein